MSSDAFGTRIISGIGVFRILESQYAAYFTTRQHTSGIWGSACVIKVFCVGSGKRRYGLPLTGKKTICSLAIQVRISCQFMNEGQVFRVFGFWNSRAGTVDLFCICPIWYMWQLKLRESK